MKQSFELEFEFMEKWGRFAKPEYLQIFLYTYMLYRKNNSVPSISEVAESLEKSERTVKNAFEYWSTTGLLVKTENSVIFTMDEKSKKKAETKIALGSKPSYTQKEIDAAASVNHEIDFLFKSAEKSLGRLLSDSDMQMLYSFVDWLGMPAEVVSMMVQYLVSIGKTGKKYMETVAMEWADQGIFTFELAEERIAMLEKRQSEEFKVRGILGIYDRALSQTEKKYITLWIDEYKMPEELIRVAYDKTVLACGKLSWAYMNKILKDWADKGIRTEAQIQESDELYFIKNGFKTEKKKKSKFNNYTDANKNKNDEFFDQVLKNMLDEE